MLVTSSSQEIRKYSMFATIFYWDYPPLHQSSAELVLCGLNVSFSLVLLLTLICGPHDSVCAIRSGFCVIMVMRYFKHIKPMQGT